VHICQCRSCLYPDTRVNTQNGFYMSKYDPQFEEGGGTMPQAGRWPVGDPMT
jgi:hypothetical protein